MPVQVAEQPGVVGGLKDLSPIEVLELRKLCDDLPYFCRKVLRVRTKAGKVLPFILNTAQLRLHEHCEEQKARTGRVRKIIVKARQLGISTYIQARYYHRLWKSKNALKGYILTHEQAATDNLFGMAQRFHELHEGSLGQAPLERGNAKELLFADNGCGYAVATAGTKQAGRSATYQLFHGSEVAFWPNAESHVNASLDTVGDVDGTEIFLESTGNGPSGMFYKIAQAALRHQSKFEAEFIPWFWDDAYQTPVPEDWDPPKKWMEYAVLHSLTWEQLYWAYEKSRDKAITISASFDEPCWMFLQEYPATFDEAFQTSLASFIPAQLILKARKVAEDIPGVGPIILGVDPARSGDKIGIIDRCGRRAGMRICEAWDPPGTTTAVALRVASVIDRIRPDAVNIDMGGVGAAIYDWLLDHGYGYCLNPVNFGGNPVTSGPTGDDLYFNRRAEMWDLARDWFQGEREVQVPDMDELQGDLCAPQWDDANAGCRYNSNNELILEEKAKIKKRLGASPDLGDAFALTFAVPFAREAKAQNQPPPPRRGRRRSGY